MKVNNPIKKTIMLGKYNNVPIYYNHTQDKNTIWSGRKDGKPSCYITGCISLNKVIKRIEEHEST